MAVTAQTLLQMSQPELDALFRASPSGPIPGGEASGTVIAAPGTEFSELAAGIANVLGWQGKVFDSEKLVLRNRILPASIPAVVATIRNDTSWFDGKECIVLDYSRTSLVAKAVRDEIRLVAPNLYLGIVYIGDEKTINFSLEFGRRIPGLWERFTSFLKRRKNDSGGQQHRFTRQAAITIMSPVKPGAETELRGVLEEIGRDPGGNALIPFASQPALHFSRVFLVPAVQTRSRLVPARLVVLLDFDAPADDRLAELVGASPGLGRVLGHCEGYREEGDRVSRLAYLRAHIVPNAAEYTHTTGRSLEQIRGEATLRDSIEDFLDQRDWSGMEPGGVRAEIRSFVESKENLRWALTPVEGPSLGERIRDKVHLVGSVAPLLLALPLAIIAAPVFALLLRWHERTDRARGVKASDDRIRGLASAEDIHVQNQYTAIGPLKPGPFRLWTALGILWGANLAARHLFNRGDLAGVNTIHSFRLFFVDNKRRLIFASNYDGSLESYMDDFIDKLGWGLNAIFSNGVDYPRTRWLIKDGASDELAFKDFIRRRQLPAQVWYTAHANWTTKNIDQNAKIRAGLSGKLTPAETSAWLSLF